MNTITDFFSEVITNLKDNLVFDHHVQNLSADEEDKIIDSEKAKIFFTVHNTSPLIIKNIKGIIKKGNGAEFIDRIFKIDILQPGEILNFLTVDEAKVFAKSSSRLEVIAIINVQEGYADLSSLKFADIEYEIEDILPRPE